MSKYGVAIYGKKHKKSNIGIDNDGNTEVANFKASNASINGNGYFTDLEVARKRRVTLNFRDKSGWSGTFSSDWNLKGDLAINFGCVGNCSGACMGSCSGGCQNSCKGGCQGNCRSSCSGGCSGGCSGSCSGGCESGCKGSS